MVNVGLFIVKVFTVGKKYTDEEFIAAVISSKSYRGVCKIIGLSPKGGNINTVKNKISKLGLNIDHFTHQNWNKGQTSETNPLIKKKDIDEILKPNSGWTTFAIKNRLFKEGLKDKKCECCGNVEWMGKPIPLELHHINGINNDHTFENLQILCSNCHSQTHNYSAEKPKKEANVEKTDNFCECGAKINKRSLQCKDCYNINKRKVIRPSIDTLILEIAKYGYVKVGEKYGVSDNTIRKWIK